MKKSMLFKRVNGKWQVKNIFHYLFMGVRNEKIRINFNGVEYCAGLLWAGAGKKI
jgi:hypothetical protein